MARKTIRKDGVPLTPAERQARRYKRKGKSINRKRRSQRKLAKLAPQIAAREARRNAIVIPDGMDYRVGDARTVLADIADNSVPLILADPPYGTAAEPLYRWLAQFAARTLIPGGSLICFTGQSMLPRDIAIFGEHLRYWWQRIMLHDADKHQQLFGWRVAVGYKPVLHYVKGHLRKLEGRSPLITDVLRTAGRDKSVHEWSQSDGGIRVLVENLTEPGETVLEPFCGAGNWGQIVHRLGRRWIGADIERGGTTTIAA